MTSSSVRWSISPLHERGSATARLLWRRGQLSGDVFATLRRRVVARPLQQRAQAGDLRPPREGLVGEGEIATHRWCYNAGQVANGLDLLIAQSRHLTPPPAAPRPRSAAPARPASPTSPSPTKA